MNAQDIVTGRRGRLWGCGGQWGSRPACHHQRPAVGKWTPVVGDKRLRHREKRRRGGLPRRARGGRTGTGIATPPPFIGDQGGGASTELPGKFSSAFRALFSRALLFAIP